MKFIALFLALLFLTLSACQSTKEERLTIAVAANMQFVIAELTQSFTAESGIECTTVIGSSGKLTAQISEGAPFDLFLSADMKYPNRLFSQNLTLQKPIVYAYGKLVLWSAVKDRKPSIELLSHADIHRIALANPKTAPYGSAAMEVLNYYNLSEILKEKLVYGENIAQTNQFITTQAVEIGFTAKSVVVSPKLKNKGSWVEIDTTIYEPIAQGIALLRNRTDFQREAQHFQQFLFSPEGKAILEKFGYITEF